MDASGNGIVDVEHVCDIGAFVMRLRVLENVNAVHDAWFNGLTRRRILKIGLFRRDSLPPVNILAIVLGNVHDAINRRVRNDAL